jgi:mannose-6-phosphate isomerase-like protein (cupin superfamily)
MAFGPQDRLRGGVGGVGRLSRLPQSRHTPAMTAAIDLAAALATFSTPWEPRTVALLNDYDVRVVKMLGQFPRHSHPQTDELFLVLQGSLTIVVNNEPVTLGPGQLLVVPAGTEHQPVSAAGAEVLLIEPSDTVNTGDSPGERTAPRRLLADPAG